MPKSMTRSTMTNNVWYRSMLVGNEPFSLGAYELIESNILTSSASSVTFSSIPQDYKHLQIRYTARAGSGGSQNMTLQFNSDSGTNYMGHFLRGNGSSVSSGANATSATSTTLNYSVADSYTAGAWAGGVIDVLDYANANKNTTLRALYGFNVSTNNVALWSGLWMQTTAISSLTLAHATTFAANSRFSLYGVRG